MQYIDIVCIGYILYTTYTQVHCTVYDRIEKEGAYDALRSTRHFGGLVWYLVRQEKMVGLMKDVVQRKL